MARCIQCGSEFNGRPNRVYCTPLCKKRAENQRARLARMLEQHPALMAKAATARKNADYHTMRLCTAKADRLAEEIRIEGKRLIHRGTPNQDIELRLLFNQLKTALSSAP